MRSLTLRELNEHHGGILPPDATLRPDESEVPDRSVPTKKMSRRTTRSTRFAALNAFTDLALSGLTGAEAKVWLILFRDTKGTGIARTGQTDIARRAGLKPRSIRNALKKLQTKGWFRSFAEAG